MEKAPPRTCSDDAVSRLVELFATRAYRRNRASPQEVMRGLVSRLRRRYRGDGVLDDRMQFYLRNRQVVSVRPVEHLVCAAALDPIGSRYRHGFNILFTEHSNRTRLRFTLAHELCHTFFYEYVPEMKFVPHKIDPMEERLCDFGAAELLMPSAAVQRSATQRPICIESLRALADQFSVSSAAMFLRLRSLKLWRCVFSEWHRMLNGNFELAKLYGSNRVPWQWEDPSILTQAWESYRSSFGSTFVRYEAESGRSVYYPAQFQIQRIGNRIFSLWGAQVERPSTPSSLFSFQ